MLTPARWIRREFQHAGPRQQAGERQVRWRGSSLAGGILRHCLVITERTAANHVANILARLRFKRRAQIGAWAVERGLTLGAVPAGASGRYRSGRGDDGAD